MTNREQENPTWFFWVSWFCSAKCICKVKRRFQISHQPPLSSYNPIFPGLCILVTVVDYCADGSSSAFGDKIWAFMNSMHVRSGHLSLPLLHKLLIGSYLFPAANTSTVLLRVWAYQHTDTANISKSCLGGLLLCIVIETQPWARQLSFQETGTFSLKGFRHSSVGTKHVEVLI